MFRVEKYPSSKYFEEDQFSIVRFEEFTKEEAVYHYHDFVEICYVYSGTGYHLVSDKTHKVSKGDLFIINYDMTHTFYRENDEEKLVTYNILFTPSFLDKMLIDLNDFSSLTMSYLFKDNWNTDILQEDLKLRGEDQADFDLLVNRIYNEYTLRKKGYINIIRAYMIELIIKILRYFNCKNEDESIQEKKVMAIDSIMNYLQTHYSRGFDLNELALKCFFSKNYLCKIFKEITGITITEYMQTLRITEASKLLETTDKKITDIAMEVGFSDYKSFNSVFKRIKGITASQYRNSILQKSRDYLKLQGNV
ncbi:MAG: AraC family transcriptional regulator [Caldicoprobacterales bacterium]|jgi:AraC family L-rhamnose operon transcriptional activator RhaR